MNNFQIEFKRLKADRGLSNKQIASFTGVKAKDPWHQTRIRPIRFPYAKHS